MQTGGWTISLGKNDDDTSSPEAIAILTLQLVQHACMRKYIEWVTPLTIKKTSTDASFDAF
jgi:hypothetical protein